jgi:hypothetical protein
MRATRLTLVLIAGLGPALCAMGAGSPCDRLVELLATQFVYGVSSTQLPRVEVRQCAPEGSATIQLVAWGQGQSTAPLVVSTGDFGVVQAVARANVFVVETGGATRDQVFVIVYSRGQPRLALQRVTKGTATVTVNRDSLELVIPGIYAGDAPARTETYHYDLR